MNSTWEICGYIATYLGYIAGGEILFIAALVSAKMGDLNLWGVLIATLISALHLDWFFFMMGRKQGQPFVEKRPKLKSKIAKMSGWMERYPIGLLLVYRYLIGFRIAVPVMLGLGNYSTLRFVFISTIGAIIWVSIFGYFGYFCAKQITAHLIFIKENLLYVILGLVILGIVYRSFSSKGEINDCKSF